VTYQAEELKNRTKAFAVRVIQLFRSLSRTEEARIIGKQVLRSSTSVAANYRAVCRWRTKAEFIAKIGTVAEEADETVFWLELLFESGIVPVNRMPKLMQEARELLTIFAASQRTAKDNRSRI
jgi:four helix bundle protein